MMNSEIIAKPIKEWYTRHYPLILGGPCSAESERQVMDTAMALAGIPEIGIFRAGIWKPRTRPSDFEGVGIKGLKWLRKAKEATGLMIAVEVGQADHVRACLDHHIDIIWLGARTVVNPFSLQEIAKVLPGNSLPVFIKNPVTPDLKLWIGALERVNRTGIDKLVAVHRGFFSPMAGPLRNDPMWAIPIELKRLYPDLPLICDPSHIAGHRDFIHDIAQQALDMGMDGLMIESHATPEKAMTDREQQLTPDQLKLLMGKLNFRSSSTDKPSIDELEMLRAQVNQVDLELIRVLSRRMDIIERIGQLKQKHNLTAFQAKRWHEVRERFINTGSLAGLDKKFLQDLLEIIHQESIRIQSRLFSGNNKG